MAHRLGSDRTRTAGERLSTPDGRTTMVVRGVGSLVLHESLGPAGVTAWTSDPDGRAGSPAVVHGDGHLLVVDAGSGPVEPRLSRG